MFKRKYRAALTKRCVPYENADSADRFDETSLLTPEHFVNKSMESLISDEDYAHAQRIWSAFSMRTFDEYHVLYLVIDVLLLADIFKNLLHAVYRTTVYVIFTHFWTLLRTQVKNDCNQLGTVNDIMQLLFVESGGMRKGGSNFQPPCSSQQRFATDVHTLYQLIRG